MKRILILVCLCCGIASAVDQAMTALEAARLANRFYLNHRQALIDGLKSPELVTRLRHMQLLTELQDPAAIPAITGFLDEIKYSDTEMVHAIRALASLRARNALPSIDSLSRHKSLEVRTAALNALDEFSRLEADHYQAMTRMEQPGFRATGVIGLAISHDQREEAVTSLTDALERDRDPHIRGMAAIGLADLGVPQAGQALTRALTDPNARVRRWAAIGLRRVNYRKAIPQVLIAMEANIASDELNRTLEYLTGEDFGFSPSAPAVTRREAINKAFSWYTDHAAEIQ